MSKMPIITHFFLKLRHQLPNFRSGYLRQLVKQTMSPDTSHLFICWIWQRHWAHNMTKSVRTHEIWHSTSKVLHWFWWGSWTVQRTRQTPSLPAGSLHFLMAVKFVTKHHVFNICLVSTVYMLCCWRCHKSWCEKNREGQMWWHYETRAWNRGDILCVLCAVAIEMLTLCGLFGATDSILKQGIDFETRLNEQQM